MKAKKSLPERGKSITHTASYDLLNKYSSFQRISETNYLMERERNTIGRYVMLTFNLRIGGKM